MTPETEIAFERATAASSKRSDGGWRGLGWTATERQFAEGWVAAESELTAANETIGRLREACDKAEAHAYKWGIALTVLASRKYVTGLQDLNLPEEFDARIQVARNALADTPTEPVNSLDNKSIVKLLTDRIRKMREVYTSQPGGDKEEIWLGHAFHLMEVRQILEGQYTTGTYDDFGAPEGKRSCDARPSAPPEPKADEVCGTCNGTRIIHYSMPTFETDSAAEIQDAARTRACPRCRPPEALI